MTLPSQQFCLYDTLFNVHNTLMKHALRLALVLSALKRRWKLEFLAHQASWAYELASVWLCILPFDACAFHKWFERSEQKLTAKKKTDLFWPARVSNFFANVQGWNLPCQWAIHSQFSLAELRWVPKPRYLKAKVSLVVRKPVNSCCKVIFVWFHELKFTVGHIKCLDICMEY